MIIEERSGVIRRPAATIRRRLHISLLLAIVGLALFVSSCAFIGTTMGIVLLLIAGALGVASIIYTLVATKQVGGNC